MTPDTPTQAAARLLRLAKPIGGKSIDTMYREDRAFIAAWDPQTITSICTALQEACAERDALRALAGELIDVGTNATQHRHWGACPDVVAGYDSRDEDCPACRVLMRADELIDGARKEGA